MTGRLREADLLFFNDSPGAEGDPAGSLGTVTYSYRTPCSLQSISHGVATMISESFAGQTPVRKETGILPPTCVIVGAPRNDDEWRAIAVAALASRLRGERVTTCVVACAESSVAQDCERLTRAASEHFYSFTADTVARSEVSEHPDDPVWLLHADFLAGVCAGIGKGVLDPTRLATDIDIYWRQYRQPIFQLAWDNGQVSLRTHHGKQSC